MSDIDKLRLVTIDDYALIDDWDLEQINTVQLDKKIVKFKYDYDSFNYCYIGIVFDDKTFAHGICYHDHEEGAGNEAEIRWSGDNNGIDYKAAYQMGLITKERYNEVHAAIHEAELQIKRAQLERLQQELRINAEHDDA